jgi:hypothetical protein
MSRLIEQLMAERRITSEWLKNTGIEPIVAWARGYRRYRPRMEDGKESNLSDLRPTWREELAIVQAEYVTLTQGWEKACMTRWAKQSNGLMRPHYFLPEMEAVLREKHMGNPHIYTQIRPDTRVKTGRWIEHEPHWNVGRFAYHLVRHESHGNLKGTPDNKIDAMTRAEIIEIAEARRGEPGWLPWCFPHSWFQLSRFLNVPGPKCDWRHTHDRAYRNRPDLLAGHLEDYHGDDECLPGPDDEHGHTELVDGRLRTVTITDTNYEYAKRLDTNPLVSEAMLLDAEVLIFVIEGAQKADTLLSVILRGEGFLYGRRAAVISAPAVGQWHARELPEFVRRYGAGKRWFVGADSDALDNPEVMDQARACCGKLVDHGAAEAYILLPPESRGSGIKRGFDDAHGEDGRPIGECTVICQNPPAWDGLCTELLVTHPSFATSFGGKQSRVLFGFISTASSASRLCDPDTLEYGHGLRALANHSGFRSPTTAGQRVNDGIEWGILVLVAGSPELVDDPYANRKKFKAPTRFRLPEAARPFTWKKTLEELERDERNSMVAIASDEQLAEDAERMIEVTQEILSIALRWQARFPNSNILATTVDRFITEALAAS